MFNPFSLSGKSILVTGASSGIGQAIAIACSKMGATVFITGRNEEKLNKTLFQLEGDGHRAVKADLTCSEDIDVLAAQLPHLQGVVHSAGIGHRKPVRFVDAEDLKLVMNTNFNGAVLLQTSLLSRKIIDKGASVVFVASKAADYPSPGNAVYSASKGAIIAYARCLALELAPRQVRVNCICPAMVWTELITGQGTSEEDLREAELKYPLKRYGHPEDIANLALYLLSDASSWMTGSCLDITGGANEL